jgi:hypothetical protein
MAQPGIELNCFGIDEDLFAQRLNECIQPEHLARYGRYLLRHTVEPHLPTYAIEVPVIVSDIEVSEMHTVTKLATLIDREQFYAFGVILDKDGVVIQGRSELFDDETPLNHDSLFRIGYLIDELTPESSRNSLLRDLSYRRN